MKKFFKEFREFALRGNVMSLAVGMMIGVAFQDVVSSLSENILSPIIGLFGGQNFDTLELNVLGINLRYGAFITSIINFIILAFVVFLIVRAMNKLLETCESKESKAKKAEKAKEKRSCPYCMTELNKDATRCPACTSMIEKA
ncbi:MAG: large conductance mechanosensitive channel protein MscL [Defluviitaleaceae bacterium]|nr:large conductance mechanosensitive channel protein MscL [Defluviitaleaceae bacterium]